MFLTAIWMFSGIVSIDHIVLFVLPCKQLYIAELINLNQFFLCYDIMPDHYGVHNNLVLFNVPWAECPSKTSRNFKSLIDSSLIDSSNNCQ